MGKIGSRLRIILEVNDIEDGLLAWRAAKAAIRDRHDDVIYAYGEGEAEKAFWVRKTKSGYSSRQSHRTQSNHTENGNG